MLTDILLLIPIILWIIYRGMRARKIISSWAIENDKEVVSVEYRLFSRGPYIFPGYSLAMVYRCEFKDKNGEKENGWLKIGNDWIGLIGSAEIKYFIDDR